MNFQGDRVILVTGASGGIGGAICRRLAAPGVGLLLQGRGETKDAKVTGLETAAKEARRAGADVEIMTCDLLQDGSGGLLVERVINRFGRLDQLVSNAGYADDRLFGKANREDLDRAFSIMTAAFFDMATAALSSLRRSPRGRVVTISSFATHQFRAGGLYPTTAAAKAGLESLTKSLAAQLAPDGVSVNCVVPGYTRKAHPGNPRVWERAAEITPMRHVAEPDDIAALVEFLLGDAARHITGQTIHVDGGLSLG